MEVRHVILGRPPPQSRLRACTRCWWCSRGPAILSGIDGALWRLRSLAFMSAVMSLSL